MYSWGCRYLRALLPSSPCLDGSCPWAARCHHLSCDTASSPRGSAVWGRVRTCCPQPPFPGEEDVGESLVQLPDAAKSSRHSRHCSQERGQEVLRAESSPWKRCHHQLPKNVLWQSLSCVPPPPCSRWKPALEGAGGDGRMMEKLGMLRGHQQQGCPQGVPITPLSSLPRTGQAEWCSKTGVVFFLASAASFLPARS